MPDSESALPSQENSPILLRVASDRLPLLTLLIGGLSFGLLPILPYYLVVSAICILGHRRHENRTWRSEWPFLIEIAGIGIALATGSALWFQLLTSVMIVAGTIAYLIFKRRLIDALEGTMVGKVSAESSKQFIFSSIIFLNILAALNLWLALRFSETT